MSSHHLSGMVDGIVCLFSRNGEMEGGDGNEERQRQFFMLAGSREGSGTQTSARESAIQRDDKQALTVLTLFLGNGF